MAQLGGPQVSALLETVPGIASVLRSPTADSLVRMIRAGAGNGDFRVEDAVELISYAVRRGLIGSDEGERLTNEVTSSPSSRRGRASAKPAAKAPPQRPRPKKPAAKKKR